MKASEMTNEKLADEIEATYPFLTWEAQHMTDTDSILREAAARLRLKQQSDNYAGAMCRQEAKYKCEIHALRTKLKVAENALAMSCMYADKLPHQWPLPDRVRSRMKNALDEIREDGGAK